MFLSHLQKQVLTVLIAFAVLIATKVVVVVDVVDASTGASLDQAGQTVDGLVDELQILQFDTPNDCLLHILNPVVGNTVSLSSDPPGLVSEFGFLVASDDSSSSTTTGDGNDPKDDVTSTTSTFLLQYENPNQDGQGPGTIIINIPLDRPTDLYVSGKTKILLNDGFLKLRKIQLEEESQLNGYMSSSEASRVQLSTQNSSLLRLDAGDNVVVEIDQHSDQATTERVLTARAVDSSVLELKGDVTSIRCEGTSSCKVDGTLTRDPTIEVNNGGAISSTATFSLGEVTIDTSTTTTTSGSTCTNGPNPTVLSTNTGGNGGNGGDGGTSSDSNGDIPSGSSSDNTVFFFSMTTTTMTATALVMMMMM